MKNVLLALFLMTSAFSFAGPKPDKCDEDLQSKVKFKLVRDGKSVTDKKSGTKQTKVIITVNNTSTVAITAKIEIFTGGKITQTVITPGKVAPGQTATINQTLTILKGKKVDNLGVRVTNTECNDNNKKSKTYLTNNREEIKDAIDQLGL